MKKDEIVALLQPFIDSCASGLLVPKKCIRLHFDLISKVKSMGVSYAHIIELANIPMSLSSFTVRMSEIRKERKGCASSSSKTELSTNRVIDHDVQFNSEYSFNDWREAFGFFVNDEVTEDFSIGFGEMGLTPENWHLYKERYNIFNAKRLAQVYANRRAHKFIASE
ncbi:TPA: hypothetical protein NKP55_004600 [Vibrio parahaemolyticus]|nr:hypothetical protein [Vibrio parahaemolyticus]